MAIRNRQETLDIVAGFNPQWFHPCFRFSSTTDKLPIDQNLLLDNRSQLPLHYSTVEHELNPWANEQCYHSSLQLPGSS
jgi:hypothetical protein